MNLLLLTNYQLEFNYNDSKITISSLTNDDTGTNVKYIYYSDHKITYSAYT